MGDGRRNDASDTGHREGVPTRVVPWRCDDARSDRTEPSGS